MIKKPSNIGGNHVDGLVLFNYNGFILKIFINLTLMKLESKIREEKVKFYEVRNAKKINNSIRKVGSTVFKEIFKTFSLS